MANDAFRDGFVRLCFDPSSNVFGTGCRVVVEGQYLTSGTATADTLAKVTSSRDVNTLYGEGSVLAESLKLALECCGTSGVEIFALPRADAAGATAAEYTLTVTGAATSAGRVDIFAGDSRWNISVAVANGATVTDIAAAIAAAVDSSFPYTATAAAGVVTFVAKNAGTVGNNLYMDVNWHGRNNYLPEGVAFAIAQTVVGATDPAGIDYDAALGDCCVCCYALASGDAAWQLAVNAYFEAAWACDSPQCFGHAYMYNAGTLGEILAGDTNSATASRLAHGNGDPILPWLKTVAYAVKSCCTTVDNPELSIQGPNSGVLDCVMAPETCSSTFTWDEQEQLRESGFVVTVPVSGGEGSLTSPQVTNDITNNRFDDEGRENLTFQSVSSRRLATETAVQIAERLQRFNGLGYFTNDTNIRQGAQGTNRKAILGDVRAWAKTQEGALFSEFDDINNQIQLTDDFDTAPRCQGVPGQLQLNMIYRPPVRMRGIRVNAVPQLLNNC